MTMTVDLPAELERRLTAAAAAVGHRPDDLVRDALNEYLGDLEDLALAEQRLDDVRAGRSRTFSLEEVERELGLAD